MADFVEVWDATGVKRMVHAVDAKEIVAAGGSYTAPEAKVEPVAEEVAEEAAEKKGKKK